MRTDITLVFRRGTPHTSDIAASTPPHLINFYTAVTASEHVPCGSPGSCSSVFEFFLDTPTQHGNVLPLKPTPQRHGMATGRPC